MKKIVYALMALMMMIGGMECSAQTVSGQIDGYDYVDLGLPSGKLWATYNVGATKPTEYGMYFRWGETRECKGYFEPYKFDEHASVLNATNDAATVNWGSGWKTPTTEEQRELIGGCTWKWTNDFYGSGVAGQVGTSKNNNSVIFLPACGDKVDTDLFRAGKCGYYWSSTPDPYLDDPYASYDMGFSDGGIFTNSYDRSWGRCVRAVATSNATSVSSISYQALQVYTENKTIHIANAQANTNIQVFGMNGESVVSAVTDGNGNADITLSASKGTYVVTIGDLSTKVILK